MSPRDLTVGVQAAVAAESAEFVHLLELDFSDGKVRLCTGAQDIEWPALNIIPNPSFEVDTDVDGMSDGWLIYNNGPEAATADRPTDPEHGLRAQRVTWSVPNTSTKGVIKLNHSMVISTYYVIAFSAKGTGGAVGRSLDLFWNTPPAEQIYVKNPPLTGSYQRYVFKIRWTVTPDLHFHVSVPGGEAAGSLTFDSFWVGVADVWEAVGGLLEMGGIEETTDARGQGIDLRLSGVDQTILAVLLTSQYRGRVVKIWRAHLDRVTGLIIGNPILLFQGLQLSPYTVDEERSRTGGTVRISTRLSGYFGVERVRGIMTNLVSHQHHFGGDLFFQHAAAMANTKIYWGTAAPMPAGASGGGAQRPRYPGDGGPGH